MMTKFSEGCDVTDTDDLAAPFEQNRNHLRGVAYRMLGSLTEADDAVQEAWLRLHRTDTSAVENLRGWLTTVVARVCLDMLRARKARREEALESDGSGPVAHQAPGSSPEEEVLLADSVGLALLIVLDTLAPAERLAFVLHDLFGVSFDEIAPIVHRSEAATRQLASRARRRVRGRNDVDAAGLTSQRSVVDAFLAALRAGDVEGLLAVLDPDLIVHADAASRAPGSAGEVRGAETWARGAVNYARAVRLAEPALLDGMVGLILAPRGRLTRALTFTFAGGRIASIEVIGEPERLKAMELAALE
jgi:RNA polymerase sigma-70 factor (ECF subfamily)